MVEDGIHGLRCFRSNRASVYVKSVDYIIIKKELPIDADQNTNQNDES